MSIPEVNLSSFLVVLFGGGGLITGLIAFLKYRPEADSIIVASATDTVEAQTIVMRNLQLEIERLSRLVKELTTQLSERDKKVEELSEKLEKVISKAKDSVIAALH